MRGLGLCSLGTWLEVGMCGAGCESGGIEEQPSRHSVGGDCPHGG